MPTIALVDDDRNILTSVSIALEAEGYRIMTYTDGASALTAQRSRAIILLLRVIEPADRGEGDRRIVKKLPRRGGRPTREAAALLQDRILDIATELLSHSAVGIKSLCALITRT